MHPLLSIPVTLAILYRAYSRRSLTPLGLLAAGLTAVAHAYHPWSVFYALLAVFFFSGTAVTKVKHAQKAKLTVSSSGGNNPLVPTPRTSVQVLANSGVASVLIVWHAMTLAQSSRGGGITKEGLCLKGLEKGSAASFMDLLPYAIFAQYAAVAADTFASELGILSQEQPILITDLGALLSFKPKRVPRGTNGGVTILGTLAGAAGAGLIGLATAALTPFCGEWTFGGKLTLVIGLTIWGTLGMLLDSVLGGFLQASVVDVRTGRVIEGDGGLRVQWTKEGQRQLVSGQDILDNNGVNFAMAATMSVTAILGLWVFI